MEDKKPTRFKVRIGDTDTVAHYQAKSEKNTRLEETDRNAKQCGCSVNKFYSIFGDELMRPYKQPEDDVEANTSDVRSSEHNTIFDNDVVKEKLIVEDEPSTAAIVERHEETMSEERIIMIRDYNNELTDEFIHAEPFDRIQEKIEEIERNNIVRSILCRIVLTVEEDKMRKEKDVEDIKQIMNDILKMVENEDETCLSSPSTEIQVTNLDTTSYGSVCFLDQKTTDIENCEDSYRSDFRAMYKSPVKLSIETFSIETSIRETEERSYCEEIEEESGIRDYVLLSEKIHKNQAERYIDEHKIKDLFNYLCSQLLAHAPKNPISFLIKLLDKCLLYRETRLAPPLLFDVKHLESLFDSMDPMRTDRITREQYETAMFTLRLKNYNPVKKDVSKDVFVKEASRVMINNLDELIVDHGTIYNGTCTSRSSSRNGSATRPNTRI